MKKGFAVVLFVLMSISWGAFAQEDAPSLATTFTIVVPDEFVPLSEYELEAPNGDYIYISLYSYGTSYEDTDTILEENVEGELSDGRKYYYNVFQSTNFLFLTADVWTDSGLYSFVGYTLAPDSDVDASLETFLAILDSFNTTYSSATVGCPDQDEAFEASDEVWFNLGVNVADGFTIGDQALTTGEMMEGYGEDGLSLFPAIDLPETWEIEDVAWLAATYTSVANALVWDEYVSVETPNGRTVTYTRGEFDNNDSLFAGALEACEGVFVPFSFGVPAKQLLAVKELDAPILAWLDEIFVPSVKQ